MPTLNLPEADIHYETFGEKARGAPILMIQGVGTVGNAWMPQIRDLSIRFPIAILDNRGIGGSTAKNGRITIESMAQDALALMDHLGWDSAHVIGHSMGGLIAQQLALDAPKRVKSLALLCTFSRGPEAARLTPWVLWMTLRTRIGTRRMRRRAFLEMLFPKTHLVSADLDALAMEIGELVGRDLAESPSILMAQLQAMRRHDAFARLSEIRVPTLVVSGQHDPIALSRFGKALSSAIPGSRFVEMTESSHGCMIQKAAEFNALYGDFLRG